MIGRNATQLGFCLAAVLLCFSSVQTWAQDDTLIDIGGGPMLNASFVSADAICKSVNLGKDEHGIDCNAIPTTTFAGNIDGIRDGDWDMGLTQSDLQEQAFEGTGVFAPDGPFEDLRALFSLYSRPLTVMTKLGLNSFSDLRGMVGVKMGMGAQSVLYDLVIDTLGWPSDERPSKLFLPLGEIPNALCLGLIDAAVIGVEHPNGIVDAALSCGAKLLPVTAPELDQLVEDVVTIRKATIPADRYAMLDEDIETLGFGVTVVTSATVTKDVAYNVVKAVFEGFEDLRKQHPALADLEKEEMTQTLRSAPLHPGAEQYFEEEGLLGPPKSAQVFWRHRGDGRNRLWQMDGLTRVSDDKVPQLGNTDWQVAGRADFNGDGNLDVLWRNQASGANKLWEMEGAKRLRNRKLAALPDTNWIVAGVGDFNGDGTDDILWHNRKTAANIIWRMKAGKRVAKADIPKLANKRWQPVGVGDATGDGKDDIFWRHKGTGANKLWPMNGFKRVANANIPAFANTDWFVAGLGHFDGDGKIDLLWRNGATGANKVWLMNGTKRKAQGNIPKLPVQWEVGGTRNYGATGESDILWHNTENAANRIWLMKRFTRSEHGNIDRFEDGQWQAQR